MKNKKYFKNLALILFIVLFANFGFLYLASHALICNDPPCSFTSGPPTIMCPCSSSTQTCSIGSVSGQWGQCCCPMLTPTPTPCTECNPVGSGYVDGTLACRNDLMAVKICHVNDPPNLGCWWGLKENCPGTCIETLPPSSTSAVCTSTPTPTPTPTPCTECNPVGSGYVDGTLACRNDLMAVKICHVNDPPNLGCWWGLKENCPGTCIETLPPSSTSAVCTSTPTPTPTSTPTPTPTSTPTPALTPTPVSSACACTGTFTCPGCNNGFCATGMCTLVSGFLNDCLCCPGAPEGCPPTGCSDTCDNTLCTTADGLRGMCTDQQNILSFPLCICKADLITLTATEPSPSETSTDTELLAREAEDTSDIKCGDCKPPDCNGKCENPEKECVTKFSKKKNKDICKCRKKDASEEEDDEDEN